MRGAEILYIGKATPGKDAARGLHDRLSEYRRHTAGRRAGLIFVRRAVVERGGKLEVSLPKNNKTRTVTLPGVLSRSSRCIWRMWIRLLMRRSSRETEARRHDGGIGVPMCDGRAWSSGQGFPTVSASTICVIRETTWRPRLAPRRANSWTAWVTPPSGRRWSTSMRRMPDRVAWRTGWMPWSESSEVLRSEPIYDPLCPRCVPRRLGEPPTPSPGRRATASDLRRRRGAGDGNRTRVSSLGSWRSTIELHRRSARRRSRRSLAWSGHGSLTQHLRHAESRLRQRAVWHGDAPAGSSHPARARAKHRVRHPRRTAGPRVW